MPLLPVGFLLNDFNPVAGNQDPNPMLASPWVPAFVSTRGNNLPFDQPEGLQIAPVEPFWDAPPKSLDPSNSNINPWDQVRIGDYLLPGIAEVDAHHVKRVHVKKMEGVDYGKITTAGKDPAEVTVKVKIWTPEQLNVLAFCLQIIDPPFDIVGNVAADVLNIVHPSLQLRNITQVVTKDVGILKRSSVHGVWEMVMHFVEYKKTKDGNNTKTADGSNVTTMAINAKASSAPRAAILPPSKDQKVLAP
jgi:hypothetical protein